MRQDSPAFKHLALIKREAHAAFPEIASSHLGEAIAAALGFGSYVALLCAAKVNSSHRLPVPESTAAHAAFNARLQALGGKEVEFVPFDHVLRQAASLSAIAAQASTEPALLQVSDLDRCYAYGIVMKRKPNGEIFATHNVAGALGPFTDLDQAARRAVAAWL